MQKTSFLWLGMLLALVVVLLIIIFPKSVYEERGDGTVRSCECYGNEFWFGTKCVGFARNCTLSSIPSSNGACEEPTCEEIFERLHGSNRILSQQLRAKMGTDVVIVMDTSNSMEGNKLMEAKRSTQRLISNLPEGERIGIVVFNTDASVVHEFSDDKENLTRSVMGITMSGGTNYLSGLLEAERLLEEQPRSAKKGIIFLSDGIPLDDIQRILEKSVELRSDGVSLFTISFDIEHDDEMNILKEMASLSGEGSSMDKWYLEFMDTDDISDAFYDAWQEISKMDVLTIVPAFDDEGFSGDDLFSKGFWVMLDSLFLTDEALDDSLCVPQMSVEAVMNGPEGAVTIPLLPLERRYVFPKNTLSPGVYGLSVDADLYSNHDGTCMFSGSLSLGSFVVEEESDRCRVPSCDEVREVLEDFDLALSEGVSLPREKGYGRVAILMDVSESMREEQAEVLRGVDRLNRLLSLGDERALIVFADNASLLVPLTRDKDAFTRSLQGVHPQGTTRLAPALVKAGFLFKEGSMGNDVVVVMSDGITYDAGGASGVLAEAKLLVDKGVCVFMLGYGNELLRDKEQTRLFRDIGEYSARKLGCGGYAYTPDSEQLSSLVTRMFGGERAYDQSLRLVVERSRGSDAGVMAFTVKAVSMQTGLELPVVTGSTCVPAPVIEVSLRQRNGAEVALAAQQYPDGVVRARSSYLFPGRYVFRADARMPIDGCDIAQSHVEEFVVLGPPTNASEGVITIIILVLASCIAFLSYRVRSAW